jgi:small subunit ribosomal protein S16
MVKIRLRRVGAKKQPTYRVVVADSRAPRDGRFIETIGHYNPRTDPPSVQIYEDRALYWLGQGAQPTGAVAVFFEKLGLPDKLKQVRAGAAIAEVAAPRPAQAETAGTSKARRGRPVPAAEAAAEEAAGAAGEAEVPAPAEPTPAAEEAPTGKPETPQAAEAATATEAKAATEPARRRGKGAKHGTVAELGLSARVAKALEEAGVDSVDALSSLLAEGDEKLLDLPGIGAKAVEEIHAKLAEGGSAKES